MRKKTTTKNRTAQQLREEKRRKGGRDSVRINNRDVAEPEAEPWSLASP